MYNICRHRIMFVIIILRLLQLYNGCHKDMHDCCKQIFKKKTISLSVGQFIKVLREFNQTYVRTALAQLYVKLEVQWIDIAIH